MHYSPSLFIVINSYGTLIDRELSQLLNSMHFELISSEICDMSLPEH